MFSFIGVVRLLFYCECYMSSLSYCCPEKERKSEQRSNPSLRLFYQFEGKKKTPYGGPYLHMQAPIVIV